MKYLIYVCLFALVAAPELHAEGTPSLSSRYIAHAIQGDLQPARYLFEGLGPDEPAADLDLADRFRQRFVKHSESPFPQSGNERVDRIIASYRTYWRNTLMADESRPQSEARLAEALRSLVGPSADPGERLTRKEIFAAVAPAVRRQGFHALASEASPLQDLFVWRGQETREYAVELVDQTRAVTVTFLSDFYSQGWKHYASLGLATTTGWVDGDTLYCVERAYAVRTENFEVSYLKHEAQHLADFERFPGLPSVHLEYRAKLTELAFAEDTLRRLLDDFAARAAPNRESPHAEANWRVLQDVYRELHGTAVPTNATWAAAELPKVGRAAQRLLLEDTERLTRERSGHAPN